MVPVADTMASIVPRSAVAVRYLAGALAPGRFQMTNVAMRAKATAEAAIQRLRVTALLSRCRLSAGGTRPVCSIPSAPILEGAPRRTQARGLDAAALVRQEGDKNHDRGLL